MRPLAFIHQDRSSSPFAFFWTGSIIKIVLVISLHAGILFAALHATGVIGRSTVPAPLVLMAVMVDAPKKPLTSPPMTPSAPRLQRAQLHLTEEQLNATAPLIMNEAAPSPAIASTVAPTVAVPTATPASLPVSVTEASFDAAYLNNPAPAYPLMSRRNGEAGRVLLMVHVTKQGTAAQVEIKQSCGFARLDEAALEAVRKWRFVPARRGDEVIAASVVVPLTFRLNS